MSVLKYKDSTGIHTVGAPKIDTYSKGEIDALLSTAGSKPKSVLVTLTASKWDSSSLQQTINVKEVSLSESNQLIQPVPAMDSQTDYYEAGVLCTSQGEHNLTFTASTLPTSDLNVYIVLTSVEPTPYLIDIDIDGQPFEAVYGSIWAEWVDSPYNTQGYTIDSRYIKHPTGEATFIFYNGTAVLSTDVINADYLYET